MANKKPINKKIEILFLFMGRSILQYYKPFKSLYNVIKKCLNPLTTSLSLMFLMTEL